MRRRRLFARFVAWACPRLGHPAAPWAQRRVPLSLIGDYRKLELSWWDTSCYCRSGPGGADAVKLEDVAREPTPWR